MGLQGGGGVCGGVCVCVTESLCYTVETKLQFKKRI